MKYKTFKLSDEKEVNKFLEENGEKLSPDSTIIQADRICFVYNEPATEEEKEEAKKQTLLAVIEQEINKRRGELISNELEIRYWTGEEIRRGSGNKLQAQKNKTEHQNRKQVINARIKYCEQIKEEIKNNDF